MLIVEKNRVALAVGVALSALPAARSAKHRGCRIAVGLVGYPRKRVPHWPYRYQALCSTRSRRKPILHPR